MTQTIRGLGATVTPVGTMVVPTAPTSGVDTKTSLTQVAAFVQGNMSRASNAWYVSNKQTGTGNGTPNNQFATFDEARAVANTGDVIIVDVGPYTFTDFATKPISIIGYGNGLTTLTGSAITLDNAAWQAATSPKIKIQGISISGSISLTSSATKSNSAVVIRDASIGSFAHTKMGNVTIGNNSIIPTVDGFNFTFCGIDNSTCLTSISGTLDGTLNSTLEINNCVTPTVNATNSGNILTLILSNFASHAFSAPGFVSLQDVIVDNGGSSSSVQVALDARSYPLNGFTDIQGGGLSEPFKLDNIARGITTFNGFGIDYDPAQSYGTYFGSTGGVDPTFFHGRNGGSGLPPTGIANFFIGSYGNPSDKNYCFGAGDGTVSAVPTDHKQVIFGATNGFAINSNAPRANFSVKAGATGDLLLSASTEVASGTVENNEINPHIEGGVVFIKMRDGSGNLTQSILGLDAEPILHTTSGAVLTINRRHHMNIGSDSTCALGGLLRPGDRIEVVNLTGNEVKIATFGSQAIYFLDLHLPSLSYFATHTQYASVIFEYAGSDVIVVKYASGEWYQV